MTAGRTLTIMTVAALSAAIGFAPGAWAQADRAPARLTVFAAASLKNALDDVHAAFSKATGIKVVTSYAATSALVKQIEAGAPADVFLSADLQWMDYAAEHKLIRPDTRVNLLGNRLVLITAADADRAPVTIEHGFDVAALVGDGRIAIADVTAVPAGRYAKAALTALGAWPAAEPKLAQAENVRAALAYVARGEAPVGVVYATDAKVEPQVKIIGTFPEGSHPPITYPVAATMTPERPATARYLDFLRSAAAKAVFEASGFSFLIRPTS